MTRSAPATLVVVAVTTALTTAMVAGCGASDALEAEPVFALDRDVAAEIDPVDPEREAVVTADALLIVLQALLTDHATLSNEAMRRAIDGRPAADTLRALTTNTDDLTAALGLVYGPAGARAFDQLWTNHIEFFENYSAAIADGDDAAADEARSSLGHYESDFSDFVSVATAGELDLDTVLHVIHAHVAQLLAQADAWVIGEHDGAVALAAEAFDHTAAVAAALAAGISAQQPTAFPGTIDDDVTACAAAHLAVRHAVTAATEVRLAERFGDGDYAAAAGERFDEVLDAAVEAVGESRLAGALERVDGADVPAARQAALTAGADAAADGRACAG